MESSDFAEESTYGSTGIGQLRSDLMKQISSLQKDLAIEVDAQHCDHFPGFNRNLRQAANSVLYATTTLQQIPQTYSNTLLTLIAFQRSYLETRALLDKFQKFDPRSYDKENYKVDLSIMGTVTDRPNLVQDLFKHGVPVWFVRQTIPDQVNICRQVKPTRPDESVGVVLSRWPRAPVFYNGPRSPGMYYGTGNWQPGSIDFSKVSSEEFDFSNVGPEKWAGTSPRADLAPDQAPSPSCSQALSKSTKSRKPYSKHQQAPARTMSINKERFQQSNSPLSLWTIATWVDALRSVDTDPRRILQHNQRSLFRGYMFPDPPALLDEKNGKENLLGWLLIRPSWISTLTGFEPRHATLPSPQQWRSYLRELALDYELVRKDERKFHNSIVQGMSRQARRNQWQREAAKEIFTAPKPIRDLVTSIPWNGHAVWTPTNLSLLDNDYRLAVWDSHEHNFRAELISLDRCVMRDAWKDGKEREHKIRAIFYDKTIFMMQVPSRFKSIASERATDRCTFVEAFRTLVTDWPGEIPKKLAALEFRKEVGFEVVWDFDLMGTVEVMAFKYYCQLFFDYFGRAPTIPHSLPTGSMALTTLCCFDPYAAKLYYNVIIML
ncbi:hypothetical protein NP233_g7127 [Leucocoprinus birnbaumii]|uniref:Uncharacterized protein n=1 Tax=Leucocoprinus birnbaumii TaxID=56174 RepID=A0AAD5VPT6_9AGAR|nr:hypothetical protein NP233_g7127 [Leucocoprinus birnbaumii]